ncbi:hypothetical protein [Streptomyces collinus]|uniref:hypothetical protein n=1 Tax=Streptomyces collinus TaxID=42684 RepID=UPI003B20FC9F
MIRPAVRSPNYVAGSTGWSINRDGSAEFNNIVIRNGTTQGGVSLYYNGTPALGNLILSIAAAAGTDPFGNAYAAGLTLYDPTGTINLDGTAATWNATPSGAGIQVAVGGGSVLMQFSPTVVSGVTWNNGATGATTQSRLGTNTPLVFIESPTNSATPGATATLSLYGGPQTSNGDVLSEAIVDAARTWINSNAAWVTGAWTKLNEAWQTPASLGTGWAAGPSGGTVQPLQFRTDAMDNLVIDGAVHTTSTTPAATIFTLPTGYRPKVTRRSPGVSNSGGTATARYAEINSNGNVSINANIATASTDVYFEVSVPLGNIT